MTRSTATVYQQSASLLLASDASPSFCLPSLLLPLLKLVKNKKMKTKKTIFAAASAFVLLAGTASYSHANNGNKKTVNAKETVTPLSENQLLVQYTGTGDNGVVSFRVQFDNPGAQKFWLIIKNPEGEILYQDQFHDAHFSKTIQFLRDEDEIHPVFIIRSGKQEIKHSFTINRKLIENVVVTKL
jgi:hypothetical protein